MREKLAIISLVSTCILLWFVLQILQNKLYTSTDQYVNDIQQISLYREQNMGLQDELLGKSSYQYIENKAQQEGFIPAPIITLAP